MKTALGEAVSKDEQNAFPLHSARRRLTRAGEASSSVKKKLKQLGYDPDATRRVAIAMYEGEINMVIHAGGGEIDVDVSPAQVDVVMADQGPGIADVEKAMQEATPPRRITSDP